MDSGTNLSLIPVAVPFIFPMGRKLAAHYTREISNGGIPIHIVPAPAELGWIETINSGFDTLQDPQKFDFRVVAILSPTILDSEPGWLRGLVSLLLNEPRCGSLITGDPDQPLLLVRKELLTQVGRLETGLSIIDSYRGFIRRSTEIGWIAFHVPNPSNPSFFERDSSLFYSRKVWRPTKERQKPTARERALLLS